MTPRRYRTVVMPCGLPLRVLGDAEVERFVHDFESVWRSIPTRTSDRLLAHWSRLGRGRPDLRLHEVPYRTPYDRQAGGIAVACCHPPGGRLDFWSPFFARLSARAAQGVIAHEIGHAAQYALRRRVTLDLSDSEEESERAADSFAIDLGHDPHIARAWLRSHTRRKVKGVPQFDEDEEMTNE